LFRLTYALETAKTARWIYRVLSDQEWSGRHEISLNGGVNGVYLSRSSLDVAGSYRGLKPNRTKTYDKYVF
ncbi:hypothetical protein FH968_22745, partial [Buttiauxella sp. B2]